MPSERPRLLQIFNRTLGGGGEDVAVERISRLLEGACEMRDCVFQSADWTGPQAPPAWQQARWMWRNPAALDQILKAHRETRAEAWILHNWVPAVSAGVYDLARDAGIPIIQFVHNFRPFSVNSYLWAGRNLEISAWHSNFLREIMNGSWQNSRLKTAWLAGILTALHARRAFRAVKAWVAVSEFMRDKFVEAGCPARDVFALRHSWQAAAVAPEAVDGGHYLFLGRLIEEKGVMVLLQAWDKIGKDLGDRAPKLIIGGDGPLAGIVSAAAARNRSIEFRGFVGGRAKLDLLSGCRGLIVPSLWWEPLGLVVYEAYDHGRPVLAARSGGLTETVRDGETGLLHHPGDSDELARQVIALEADPAMRLRMGLAGRRWLQANASGDEWRRRFFEIVMHAEGRA